MTAVTVSAIALLASILFATIDSESPSREERFAETYCATKLPWAKRMLDTYEAVHATRPSFGQRAKDRLGALAQWASDNAFGNRRDLRALRAPDSDVARKFKRYFVYEAAAILGYADDEVRRVQRLPADMTIHQDIRALESLEEELISILFRMLEAESGASIVVPKMRGPLEKAASCAKLDALGAS